MVIIIRTTIVFILMAVLAARSQTIVPGGNVDGEWTLAGSPYLITGNITVGADDRLAIAPGTEVVFTGPYAIEVNGRLEAIGTANDSITFTAQDTTGFTGGNYINWLGIGFLGFTSNQAELSRLEYCIVEFSAGSGVTCMNYDNLLIRHSTIRMNGNHGILLMEFADITIEDIVIERNGNKGLSVNHSSPQVSNYVLRNNYGSGLSVDGSSAGMLTPLFVSGIIHNNHSTDNGGGICITQDVLATFNGLELYSNSAELGGGIFMFGCSAEFQDAFISGNSAVKGGGIYLGGNANLSVGFAVISYNAAGQYGGGIANEFSNMIANRCTFAFNSADISGGGLHYQIESNVNNTITNSVIWQNYSGEIISSFAQPIVTFSDVMGGYPGEGNIDADPLFEDPVNNNFQLTWAGYPVVSEFTSPCIDSGNPASEPDPDLTIADMGAHYFEQFIITSNQKKTAETMITIYPNPATTLFVIEGTNAIERVNIINLSGQRVRTYTSTASEYRIEDLHPGVYLVQVMTYNGNVTTRKLIKN
jgi:hypothetical protein